MQKTFDFKDNFEIMLSVASGVESVLKTELKRLNIEDYKCDNGSITFLGDALSVAKCNINLRTADRVYIKIAEFDAFTFNQLFDGTACLPWENYFPKDANVIVNGKCVKSDLFSISDCQKIIKKAISVRLCEKYRVNRLEESGSIYALDFYLFKNRVILRLNTSGAGLHKRGYRDLVGIAPIKETLASALLLMSDFYYLRPFADPFCGSGTLAIEGARIALNIASGIGRRFAFNDWQNFDQRAYDLAFEEAKDKERRDIKLDFYASDIDKKAVNLAMHHAERAGVKDKIKFSVCDVKNFKTSHDKGTIVTNPPYGERVYDRLEAEQCNKSLGRIKKENPDWSIFAITSYKNFEKTFGAKADRERKMYNSNKECRFYYYYGKR